MPLSLPPEPSVQSRSDVAERIATDRHAGSLNFAGGGQWA